MLKPKELETFGDVDFDSIGQHDYGRWVVYNPGYTAPILGIMTRPADKSGYVVVDFSKGEQILPAARLKWGSKGQSTSLYARNEAVLAMVRQLRNQDAKLWSINDAIMQAEALLWPDMSYPKNVGDNIKGQV